MFSAIRVLITLVVVAFVAFLLLGYWAGSSWGGRDASPLPTGTSGVVNVEKARERGAEIGEKTAVAAREMKQTLDEASLTGKIKAKMALDDSVRALAIDVTTSGTTVTLSGHVNSAAEHDRAVALARETAGVTGVVDHLELR
jgi:osmotically-inducible protein OsmY